MSIVSVTKVLCLPIISGAALVAALVVVPPPAYATGPCQDGAETIADDLMDFINREPTESELQDYFDEVFQPAMEELELLYCSEEVVFVPCVTVVNPSNGCTTWSCGCDSPSECAGLSFACAHTGGDEDPANTCTWASSECD